LPETLLGNNAFNFIHPDDREKTLPYLEKIATEKTVKVHPFRFQNSKGEWHWIETTLTNMFDNPAIKGIVSNARDVTEKVKEERQRKLLESVI
ncbi:PAS domain S-box protein, partial [Acinetobacter baumannii]